MDKEVSDFINQIMVLGSNGRWPNSSGDLTIKLKEKTAQFAELVRYKNPSVKNIEETSRDIEGLVLSVGVVNGWTQEATDYLIDKLRKLTNYKIDILKNSPE